ncbi:tol-pal system protein YbgF [Caenimonas terrae]|uniref:Cell division coordinator CpoB n=1 Tax=Caenimonas terrae TaxID=696074 RepID=A0ABW0NGU9_9BURK
MKVHTAWSWRPLATGLLLAGGALLAGQSHAALFEDDEARRAILDLRGKVEQQRLAADAAMQRQADDLRRATDDNGQLRRSLLDLQNQIEALRGEIAAMRGQNEQLARSVSELQRGQKDIATGVEERLRKFEPAKVTLDGREFTADPAEMRDFEASLAIFRRGDFPAAQTSFTEFVKRYPQSGYRGTALFWLGNAQYANRDYRGAIANFRALLAQAPDHARAPEALLSIANCQIELKDNPGARRTLEELTRSYPQSEAANAARERLARR